MIRYKLGVLGALKKAGYSSYRLRQEKVFGQATITQLRNDEIVSLSAIDTLCRLLHCQPGDLLEYISDGDQE